MATYIRRGVYWLRKGATAIAVAFGYGTKPYGETPYGD